MPDARVLPTFALAGAIGACALFSSPGPVGITGHEACAAEASARGVVGVPGRSISGPSTALCNPSTLAQAPNGELYVLNHAPEAGRHWVTVYDSAAAGDAPPARILRLHHPSRLRPIGLGVDREGSLTVRLAPDPRRDRGAIAVFARGADGNVAPIRVLSGPRTGLIGPGALALDRRGYLYVANSMIRRRDDTVRVFAPDADGDVAPVRVLAGPQTRIASPSGLAVDREDRLYVGSSGPTDRSPLNAVTVYAAGAAGDAAPVRVISGGQRYDGMGLPERLGFGRGDSLYVRSLSVLAVYAPRASQAMEPARYVLRMVPGQGFARIEAPRLVALGPGDTLYAVSADTVQVFPPGYAGAGEPARWIAGPGTGLREVKDIAVDRRGWLYVAMPGRRWDQSVIRVYRPGASGDAAPARSIEGSRTLLAYPTRLAVDRAGRLYVANAFDAGGSGATAVYSPGAEGDDRPARMLEHPDSLGPRPT